MVQVWPYDYLFTTMIKSNKTFILGTMRNWLHYCGFSVRETKKGIYYDGHERPDVKQVLFSQQY